MPCCVGMITSTRQESSRRRTKLVKPGADGRTTGVKIRACSAKDYHAFRRYFNLGHDMSSDELLVLEYLKRFPHTFTDASQICKQASTLHRYAAEPQWAGPALQILEI